MEIRTELFGASPSSTGAIFRGKLGAAAGAQGQSLNSVGKPVRVDDQFDWQFRSALTDLWHITNFQFNKPICVLGESKIRVPMGPAKGNIDADLIFGKEASANGVGISTSKSASVIVLIKRTKFWKCVKER